MCKLIIFDLDGTLLDTSEGIFNSVKYAELELGLKHLPINKLKEFVGPPPKSMYMKLHGLDEVTAIQATEKHREYSVNKAIYESKLYDGVENVLKNLKDKGCYLAVATLKKQNVAEKVLEYHGLKKYFHVVVGMDKEETYTKCKTIQIVMEYCNANAAIMIGDTVYDEIGAKEANVDFIAVLYGFGYKEDKCGYSRCLGLALNPKDILSILKKLDNT